MVPIAVQKIIIGSAPGPSILVLQPIEESPVPGISRIVPIMVGAAEAAQLHLAVTHTKVARPTTHDLLLDALTNLDASVDHVLIDKVKGSLFFAKLTLSQHGRLIELDARPSDALSLALREDAPLYQRGRPRARFVPLHRSKAHRRRVRRRGTRGVPLVPGGPRPKGLLVALQRPPYPQTDTPRDHPAQPHPPTEMFHVKHLMLPSNH